MRPRGSIVSQLLIAFSVFAVLIVVAMAFGYYAAGRQDTTARQLTGRDYVLQQTAGHMQEDFTTSQIAVTSFVLSGQRGFLRPVAGERASFARNAARLRALAPPGLQRYVTGMATSGTRLFAVAAQVARLPRRSPAAAALASSTALTAGVFYRAGTGMQDRLAAAVRLLTSRSKDALATALTWSGIALVVAMLLVLGVSLSTLRTITRPLRSLSGTVRRLTAGDRSARAPVTGTSEVREVARAVNTQADEAERLRRREEENNRLRAMARAAGTQIREHLAADDVLRQAHRALAGSVGADRVYLHLVTDGKMGPPVGHDGDWLLPESFLTAVPAADIEDMRRLLRNQASRLVHTEHPAAGRDLAPAAVREYLRRAGIASCLLTPFGVGTDLLGIIAAVRLSPSRPWTAAEIDAVESIAADLGRGLNHARLYESENRLVTQLQELDRVKSDFFATVSHELRAPLTSIEGYVEMLAEEEAGPMNAEQRRMLGTVERSAVRLRNLIEDVFTLAKLESEAFAAAAEPVNVVDVVTAAVAAVGPSASAGELQLSSSLPDGAVLVRGDVSQLDRVFINLLSNAVKFTPAGGRVQVTGTLGDGWVTLRVADTGIGIPEAEQDKLFTRFFRASTATERAIPGTGLGLAIVSTIVSAHDGEIALRSRAGEGTTVTVRLPLLGRDAANPGSPEPGAAQSA
jgi:two-component system phosphate regulon sensor histidine kinase PhoR